MTRELAGTTEEAAQAACEAVEGLLASHATEPAARTVAAARRKVLAWLVALKARAMGFSEGAAERIAATLPRLRAAQSLATSPRVRTQLLAQLENPAALELGSIYEALCAHDAGATGSGGELAQRRRRGTYYTPPGLVDVLLETTLAPTVAEVRTAAELTALRVCDPACGAGHFLLAAAERLVARLQELDEQYDAHPEDAWQQIVPQCLVGLDTDPLAAPLTRIRLALAAGVPALAEAAQTPQIRTGNGLFEPPCAGASKECVDVVLGNPPFVNAIERDRLDAATKKRLRAAYPEIRGTADLAHYFLVRGVELLKPGKARLGFVLPRTTLNAASLERWRGTLAERHGVRPESIYVPPEGKLFEGADVYVCLLTLGPGSCCRVSDAAEPRASRWRTGRLGKEEVNWWAAFERIRSGRGKHNEKGDSVLRSPAGVGNGASAEQAVVALADCFEVRASMTAPEAYELRPHVHDEAKGEAPRLHTTGLIDPGVSHWGTRRCRYLRGDYLHPRVRLTGSVSRSLERRIAQASRPKLLIAGLAKRLECWFDRHGEAIGAVSTYTITHPTDDVAALAALAEYLHGEEPTERLRRELGANAMTGGNITVTKAWLKQLPIPTKPHAKR